MYLRCIGGGTPAPTPVTYAGQFGTVSAGTADTKSVGIMARSGQLTGEVECVSTGESVGFFPLKITVNSVDTTVTMTTESPLHYKGLVSIPVAANDVVTMTLSNTLGAASSNTVTGSWSLELN